MKTILIDPQLNWYKANLHCHTTLSDGRLSPEEIKDAYKSHGYSVVAYTDHEVIFDHSDLCDKDFIALTATEYSMNLPKAPDDWAYGDHWSWHHRRTIHFNLFSRDPHNTFHPGCSLSSLWGDLIDRYAATLRCDGFDRTLDPDNLNEVIRRANESGFLVQYNHPNWSLNTRDEYLKLKGLWSLEIYNHLSELETGAEYCPYIYDDMLRSGMRLYCSMGDDNHNEDKSLFDCFGGFNMIGAPSLSYDNIFHGMETGTFYCSQGPLIHSLYVENGTIYLECDEVTDANVCGYARSFRNKHDENGFTHAEFPILNDEAYFRVSVRDRWGRHAHTHVYFMDEIQK